MAAHTYIMHVYPHLCVCVCARARARVRACCVCECMCMAAYMHTPIICIPYITMHSLTETYVLFIIYIPPTYSNILLSLWQFCFISHLLDLGVASH